MKTLTDDRANEQTAWGTAWRYVSLGWSVIPLDPNSKKPSVRWEVYQTRRPTDAEVESWFEPNGTAGIGIVTGNVSGIVVVDADDDDAVSFLAERFAEADGPGPPMVKTSRGVHAYFRVPDGERIATIRGLLPGIDLKADGSFVVAPPSVHPDGHVYRWLSRFGPRFDLPPLPSWVREAIRELNAKRHREPHAEGPITEGERNDTLTRIAGAMRRHGASEPSIASALQAENRTRCQPPLPDAEVGRIAASVSRYAPEFDSFPLRKGRGTNRILERIDAVGLHAEPFEPLESLPLVGQEGFVIEGLSNLVAAYPKVGKTTGILWGAVLPWLASGRRVVYLSEEPKRLWQHRLQAAPADRLRGLSLVLMAGYSPDELFDAAFAGDDEVVVVDTLRTALKFDQEKDNSELLRMVEPWIVEARQRDRTLVCLHHETKAGGAHGRGIAGGHALFGAFDMAVEIDRVPEAENRRRVRGYGRLTVPPDFLYEERDGQMIALWEVSAIEKEAVRGRVLDALTDEPQKASKAWESLSEPRPGQRQVREALNALVDRGEAVREGAGNRGDPYRWRRLDDEPDSIRSSSIPKGEGIE
jgi:hypothetical protein